MLKERLEDKFGDCYHGIMLNLEQ